MPAQIMVTHLKKADVQKMIGDLKATELVSIQDSPPPDPSNLGFFLVVCAEKLRRPVPGAAEALQKIADADSALVRAAEPAPPEPEPTPKVAAEPTRPQP